MLIFANKTKSKNMAENQKERLIVRNFGPISNLDIEIRPLTLFIGTQGSGKSTVSKLLTICRDLRWWLQIIENNNTLKPFFDFNIDEYFNDKSYIRYLYDDFEITYQNASFSYKSFSDVNKENLEKILKTQITKSATSLLERTGLSKDDISDPHTLNLLKANSRMGLYILAERNLVGNLTNSLASIMLHDIPLSNPLLEYMSLFEKAKKDYSSYNVPFFNVSFVKKEGRERIELKGKNKDLPLSACSSGLQSALPMLMVIDYAIKTNCFDAFVIEEPEQNLFPENQFETLCFITSKFWDKKQRQFVITTHSPYMLSSLNVLMLAYRLRQNENVREHVDEIVKPGFTVNPDNVAVYSLNPDGEEYCKSLISEETQLVSVNELDSVSEIIGDDFERLYSLYLQTKKKSR